MKSTLNYTFARIGLLVVAYGLGYLAGLRSIILIIAAFLGSSLISFFVLNKQRNAMGQGVNNYFSRINDKIDASTKKEDVD
jgi:hypothetical protein